MPTNLKRINLSVDDRTLAFIKEYQSEHRWRFGCSSLAGTVMCILNDARISARDAKAAESVTPSRKA